MNTPSEDEVRLIVAKQAADWFVNNRSAVAEEQERVTFMNWLRTSPLHVEEYLRIAAISRDLQAVAADPTGVVRRIAGRRRRRPLTER